MLKSAFRSFIDLMLPNNPKRFQNTGVMESEMSDHNAFFSLFQRLAFKKMSPNKLQYRTYKQAEKALLLKSH